MNRGSRRLAIGLGGLVFSIFLVVGVIALATLTTSSEVHQTKTAVRRGAVKRAGIARVAKSAERTASNADARARRVERRVIRITRNITRTINRTVDRTVNRTVRQTVNRTILRAATVGQVEAAVTSICQRTGCARSPTLTQVVAALRLICGTCTGPPGRDAGASPEAPSSPQTTPRPPPPAHRPPATLLPPEKGDPGDPGERGPPGPEPLTVPATRVGPLGMVENCTASDPDGDGHYDC